MAFLEGVASIISASKSKKQEAPPAAQANTNTKKDAEIAELKEMVRMLMASRSSGGGGYMAAPFSNGHGAQANFMS